MFPTKKTQVFSRKHSDEIFAGDWNGRRGTIARPSRSPDLTPFNYLFEDIEYRKKETELKRNQIMYRLRPFGFPEMGFTIAPKAAKKKEKGIFNTLL